MSQMWPRMCDSSSVFAPLAAGLAFEVVEVDRVVVGHVHQHRPAPACAIAPGTGASVKQFDSTASPGLHAGGLERHEHRRAAGIHGHAVPHAEFARELGLERRHLARLAAGLAVAVQLAAGHQRQRGLHARRRDRLLLRQVELEPGGAHRALSAPVPVERAEVERLLRDSTCAAACRRCAHGLPCLRGARCARPPGRPCARLARQALPGHGLDELADRQAARVARRAARSAGCGSGRCTCRRRPRWFLRRGTASRSWSGWRATSRGRAPSPAGARRHSGR